MACLLDFSKPYMAYYSVPAALGLALMPTMMKSSFAPQNLDRTMPRKLLETCANDPAIDKKTLYRIQRADAAAANGFETLGLYAGAVAAAASAGVPAPTLNRLAAGYLVSRLGYNVVYVLWQGDSRSRATVRSLLWTVGVGVIGAMWVKAGNLAALGRW